MSNLLQLRTDLKSLKYGKDRLDGGDSGQPYIKKDINDANPTNSGLTAVNKDFLLRGGTAALSSTVEMLAAKMRPCHLSGVGRLRC